MMQIRKRRIWLVFAIAVALFTSCGVQDEYRSFSGAVWGTTFHIVYKAPRDLTDSIYTVMTRIDNSLSMFNPNSTVSRINSHESAIPDNEVLEVWNISRAVHEASGGRFDPTVAPLVDLWGFGRKGRDVSPPDSAEITGVMEGVGLGKWSLEKGVKVIKPTPDAAIDFSAVAKGYGVDCIAGLLRRNGSEDFMVEVGGEIALHGLNPKGKLWRVQIDAPVDTLPGSVALRFIDTTDCAIATSGNYRNYQIDKNGSKYGHTIDPLTGYPRTKSFQTVTVIGSSCALADALATAMMASEPDSALVLPSRFNARAYPLK